MPKTKNKSFSNMTSAEFQASYLKAVSNEQSYVGGDGCVEEDLWWVVEAHQKWAAKHQAQLPDYESIDTTQEDWV